MKLPLPRRLRKRAEHITRALRTRLTPARARLLYHDSYRPPRTALTDHRRAEKILRYLLDTGCITSRHLLTPKPATIAQLLGTHPLPYLESLLEDAHLDRVFGRVADTLDGNAMLEAQRWMVGGTLMAARRAVATGHTHINLGGGLHHAARTQGSGFCLFNDVAVAIAALRAEGWEHTILVLDLDLHHGEGTRAVFASDPTVWTVSLHAVARDDSPAVASIDRALGLAISDPAYLSALDEILEQAMEAARPALIFYVAGVDVAMDDRLGSWRLSSDAILERDQRVVRAAGGRPLVWTLAGGYGEEAWRHSARSLAWFFAEHDAPIDSLPQRQLSAFREIASALGSRDLGADATARAEDPWLSLSQDDLFGALRGDKAPQRLLGFYTAYGVELALERYGVTEHIQRQGIPRIAVELELEHEMGHRLQVVSADYRRDVLIELILAESLELEPYTLLAVEWMLLQNPRAFPEQPLLPGQDHPGLGCMHAIVGMLAMSCERLGFDGLLFRPAHYHIAALARGFTHFVDPEMEALFATMQSALEGLDLRQASEVIDAGSLQNGDGVSVTWPAARIVMPVSEALTAHFRDETYTQAVEDAAGQLSEIVIQP